MLIYSLNQSYNGNNTKDYFANTTPWSFDLYSSDHGVDPTDYMQLHSDRQTLYIAIPLTFLYSFLLITGILGNVITCAVILRNKYLHTATNYYLFSLAISDLLLLVFGLPLEIYYIWRRYPYIFGETFCVMRGLMAETSANASVLTITAFTVERYVAICYPFFSYTLSNLSRAIKLILGIWITSLMCAIPQAIQFGVVGNEGSEFRNCTMIHVFLPYSFELSALVFFVIPMIIITILYIRIGVKLKISAKLKEKQTSRPMLGPENQQNSSQRLLGTGQPSPKIHKMLVAVVITFFICWAPFHIQRIVAMRGMRSPDDPASNLMAEIYDVVTYTSAILFYLSTTVNPILYHTMSHKFRDAFKDTAKEICCRGGNNDSKFNRHRSSQIYHNAYKTRLLSGGSSGTEYSPNNQTRGVYKEIETDVTTNCNNVDLVQFDLNNRVLSRPDYVKKKMTSVLDDTNVEKEVAKKRVFIWYKNNNNNVTTINNNQESLNT